MMNIRYLFVAVFAGLTLLTSCENIDESDRLIEVTPTEVSRAVLVEEFSGQFCVNCPYGAAQLHRMEAEYGADSLVVVTIHCGVKEGFGIDPNDPDLGPLSLVTADGEKRFDEVGRPAQPAILVDRRGGAVGRSDVGSRPEEDSKNWLTAILNAFQLPAMVEMEGRAYQKNEGEAELTLTLTPSQNLNGAITVWVTESDIIGVQKYPTGYEMNYQHNNIFRKSITPMSGESVELKAGETKELSYSFKLAEGWNADNLNIVAFVSDNNGVCQTVKIKLEKTE